MIIVSSSRRGWLLLGWLKLGLETGIKKMFLDFFFVTGLSCIIMISRGRIWVCWNADVVKVDALGMSDQVYMFVSLY